MKSPEPKPLSAWLLVAAGVLLAAFFVLVAAGERGGDTFFSNPWLSLTMLGAVVCAIAAGVAGIVAFRRGDRSLVAGFAVVVGAFVVCWVVAEIAFPH
mgnify:FL=1